MAISSHGDGHQFVPVPEEQGEFNERITTLETGKACEGGLILLKRRANQDPALLNLLPEIPENVEEPSGWNRPTNSIES